MTPANIYGMLAEFKGPKEILHAANAVRNCSPHPP